MPVYYDHGSTRVTDRWLIHGDQRYPIDQLSNLRTTRAAARAGIHGTGQGRDGVGWGLIGLVAVMAAVVVTVHVPLPVAVAVTALAVVAVARLAVRRLRRRRAGHLLIGEYNGYTTELYHSRDVVEFGKLSRAMARARSYRPSNEDAGGRWS
jgi:hypothetical protein